MNVGKDRLVALVLLSCSCAAIGCSSPTPAAAAPGCVQGLPDTCASRYNPPTFDKLYTNIFEPTCGRSNCHNSTTQQAGLILDDPDKAYDTLLGLNGAPQRVIPGDAHCSLLVERLESTNPDFRMPSQNDPLPDLDRCAIRTWITGGAPRGGDGGT